MKLKLIQIGSSLGVVIPKDVIKSLKLKQGDYVNVMISNENPDDILKSLKEEVERANEVISQLLKAIKIKTGEYF